MLYIILNMSAQYVVKQTKLMWRTFIVNGTEQVYRAMIMWNQKLY